MSNLYHAPEFWQAVSFFLLLIMVFRPVKNLMVKILDNRALKIKDNVEEMNKLIAEVGLSLDQIKAKYDTIDQELETIALNTEREIDLLKKTAEKDIAQYINQKTSQLLEKIASDERKALEKLRKESVNSAIAVSKDYIREFLTDKVAEEQLEKSLVVIKDKLKVS